MRGNTNFRYGKGQKKTSNGQTTMDDRVYGHSIHSNICYREVQQAAGQNKWLMSLLGDVHSIHQSVAYPSDHELDFVIGSINF